MSNLVTVYSPLVFAGNDSEDGNVNIARSLASNSIQPTFTKDWNVLNSKSFIVEHKDCQCSVYVYHLSPPKIQKRNKNKPDDQVPCSSKKVADCSHSIQRDKIYWCMSSVHQNLPHESSNSFRSLSPTDNTRYKTIITINGDKDLRKETWNTLCKSLQNGELVNCNAYYKETKEIVIYHDGIQQAQVGEWIWKKISCQYSKTTHMVLLK